MALKKTTLLLAEDHDLVRAGFKAILGNDDSVVVLEAEDGEKALALTLDQNPDVLFIDLSMPKLSGIAVITKLKKLKHDVKIIVLTAAESAKVWKEVLDLGVEGIALKSISKNELLEGVNQVLKGQQFVHSEIEPDLNSFMLKQESKDETEIKKLKKLSLREKQVTKLVAEGYKTKEIADLLQISDRTVSKHRENIMAKLGMDVSAELVNYASHIGLLKVDLDEIE